MPKSQKDALSANVSNAVVDPATTYEQAIEELEAIIGQMEDGSLGLEQSLIAYQRGAALVKHCKTRLASVDQQVKILEDGMLKVFEEQNGDISD
jgi:exodeoxyribonuclease VII small subunit